MTSVTEDLDTLKSEALSAIEKASDLKMLDDVRVAELGKKGRISGLMKTLGKMSPDERKDMGPKLNGLRTEVDDAVKARKAALEIAELNARLEKERVDLTLPPVPESTGALHPVMQVFEEIAAIFGEMGFTIAEGPDIEDDFHNFTALNFPPGHPAREMHDTFFMQPDENGDRKVLRTHTSPVQIREMMNGEPPFRLIAPGRVYQDGYGRDPYSHVPPGRRPGHRQNNSHGSPETLPDRFSDRIFRSRQRQDTLSPPLFSFHRTIG